LAQPDTTGPNIPAASPPKLGTAERELRGFLYSFHHVAAGEFWPLYSGENILGRADSGEELNVAIRDPTTSSQHAVLTSNSPGHFVLHDVGSTNGSFVNDRPLGCDRPIEIRDGDRIRLGAYHAAIRFVIR
jgi:hypothetical protein